MAVVIQTFTRELAVLEYGVACVSAAHRCETGDRHLVKTIPNGTLLAVVNGAGSCSQAAEGARRVIRILENYAQESPPLLVRRCHQDLRSTGGVVMSLAVLNAEEDTVTWLGVGNVAGTLVRASSPDRPICEAMTPRPGVVGSRLPVLQALASPIASGDLIVLATGGIRPDCDDRFPFDAPPRAIAEHISSTCYAGQKGSALVLVARYQGLCE
jgi:negative regulator of sigma-B (phosphoserine phosphatase)